MSRWTHPDRLDRVASGGDPGTSAPPAAPPEVTAVLARALAGGRLTRIPRKPEHRDVVLAVLAAGMRPRLAYAEVELNDYLESQLETLRAGVDHVTCRRLMVDVGFLKRDRAGARYFLNPQKLRTTLADDTVAALPELVRDAFARCRA